MSSYNKPDKDGFVQPYKKYYRTRKNEIILNPKKHISTSSTDIDKKYIKDEHKEDIRIREKRFVRDDSKERRYNKDDDTKKYKEDIPFTIIGAGQKARERMIENINSNLDIQRTIDITELLSFTSEEIIDYITPSGCKKELNMEIWDNTTFKTLLSLKIIFCEEHKCKINYAYSDDEITTMLINQDEFVNLIMKTIFKYNGLNIMNHCITFSNTDINISTEDKDFNKIGIITYALHNDTPDCRIKYFELMKVILYNMFNLFVKGYAGKAYMFRINPQGSRICFEYHYDLDDWKLLLDISKYFNKIFNHVKCTGWIYDINKAYMKYEFIRYVKGRK